MEFLLLLLYDVDCLGAFRTLFDIEADSVTLGKGFEPVALDGSVVNKDIGAVFSGNKAEPFGVIEPLYCALSHRLYLLVVKMESQNS